MANLEAIRNENKKVQEFILQWTEKNLSIDGKGLILHNAKFTIDFNAFLDKGNFSKATIDLFKI